MPFTKVIPPPSPSSWEKWLGLFPPIRTAAAHHDQDCKVYRERFWSTAWTWDQLPTPPTTPLLQQSAPPTIAQPQQSLLLDATEQSVVWLVVRLSSQWTMREHYVPGRARKTQTNTATHSSFWMSSLQEAGDVKLHYSMKCWQTWDGKTITQLLHDLHKSIPPLHIQTFIHFMYSVQLWWTLAGLKLAVTVRN